MLAILTVLLQAGPQPAPSNAEIGKAWRENAIYCQGDLELKGPLAKALMTLQKRGISPVATRHLALACAKPFDPSTAIASMRAALEAGPRLPVSIELRKLLSLTALREHLESGHRTLAEELEEPERAFALALIDSDPAPVAKLEAAVAALPSAAPASARAERSICLAAALCRAGRMDQAKDALPPAPAYPQRRKAILAQIAARAGDATLAKQLLDEGRPATDEGVPCERALKDPECGVVRGLLAAGRVAEARALKIRDCGAIAAWAEANQSPFDAYLALVEASDYDRSTLDAWLREPRLLLALGRPDLARERLEWSRKSCADEDRSRQLSAEICKGMESFAAKIPASPAPAAMLETALLERLRAPARWREYAVVAAPPGKAAPRKKQLTVPGETRVVFSAVEGARAVAVVLSRDVDPRGEVSAGGYVVYLSNDGGKAWHGPLHTGFASGFPFFVKESSKAKVFDGDVLQLPVDLREIDPASITFPPVALKALREQRDRLVRIPIATLEQDSDEDGLTDLLEERLGTDPKQADTDGDGTPDAWDHWPLEKSGAESPAARFARVVLDAEKPRAIVHEPGSDAFQLAGQERRPSLPTRFVQGAAPLPELPGRTIRLSTTALEAYANKLGPIYPITLEIIVSGKRAIVDVQESWRGATYLVEEQPDGSFSTRVLSSWIS